MIVKTIQEITGITKYYESTYISLKSSACSTRVNIVTKENNEFGEVDMTTHHLFLMNNDGKTIDHLYPVPASNADQYDANGEFIHHKSVGTDEDEEEKCIHNSSDDEVCEECSKITDEVIVKEIRRYIKHRTDDTELGKCIRHFMSVMDEINEPCPCGTEKKYKKCCGRN